MKSASPFPPGPAKKKSPFPRRSLPQAGDSLQDAFQDLVLDKFLFWVAMAATLIGVAIFEWLGRWIKVTWSPWWLTSLAVVASLFAAWRWWRVKPQLLILQQAIRGERAVGRMLEDCRSLGYEVFHDIPGNGFNVDHTLIGPGGVFAIETKTISKPTGHRAKVDYDGKQVVVDGWNPDRDPVAQAEAVADFIGELLQKMTSRDVDVRPVVLFPGWWITPQPRDARVWVLNPKAVYDFLANEPKRLSKEDMALYVDRLTRHLSPEQEG